MIDEVLEFFRWLADDRAVVCLVLIALALVWYYVGPYSYLRSFK